MAAVLRSCEAFGLQDVHVVENPDVPFAPHDKVTQGCDKWLDVHRHRSFAACARALRAAGYRICVSAVREDARSVFEMEFDRPLALVFGNERTGVTPDALAAADEAFWIPMRGFTRSLNVSAAVSATLSRAIGWRLDHGARAGPRRGGRPRAPRSLLRAERQAAEASLRSLTGRRALHRCETAPSSAAGTRRSARPSRRVERSVAAPSPRGRPWTRVRGSAPDAPLGRTYRRSDQEGGAHVPGDSGR